MVCFDVQGTFNGVALDRLKYNLSKGNVDLRIIDHIVAWMQNRETAVHLPETTAKTRTFFRTPTVVHKPPLSPILYLFCNAALLDDNDSDVLKLGFVDGIGMIVSGSTTEGNCASIGSLWPEMLRWSRRSSSNWSPDKTEILYFSSEHQRVQQRRDLQRQLELVDNLTGQVTTTEPKHSTKCLGVT